MKTILTNGLTYLLFAFGIAAAGCAVKSSQKADVANIADEPGQIRPEHGPATFDRGRESYQIYSIVLNHKWEGGNVVVRDRTDAGLFQNDQWLDTNVGNKYPDAVKDYKLANETAVQIEDHFDYSGKVALISEAEARKTINGPDGWDAFRKDRPDASGIVTLSAVGFDLDASHAIVNVSYLCASHCGNGTVFVLEKKDGAWKIEADIGTWMS